MTHKVTHKTTLDEDTIRLLNNGGELPNIHITTARIGNELELYISRSDLLEFLRDMQEVAISDQKQEAYKGVRKLLKCLK